MVNCQSTIFFLTSFIFVLLQRHKISLERKLRRSFDDICKNYHCTLQRHDHLKSKHDEKHLEFHFNLIADDANKTNGRTSTQHRSLLTLLQKTVEQLAVLDFE
ncbi:hypothetical protein EG68_10622 [Paragonimus skrjabini miyazakii]|uniref:Uncharacterized protein n=1 Tax=Paragonimus skrjabini miyazakii TaxID=59628 RepID=A0A8S9YFS9_9TREM|nr:hypothetical protein EG68_10622 [Paragonimus skrjabini miyazakii]